MAFIDGYEETPDTQPPLDRDGRPESRGPNPRAFRDQIIAAYRELLGRDPDESEITSDEDNASRYGFESVLASLRSRSSNAAGPGGGGPGGGGPGGGSSSPFNEAAVHAVYRQLMGRDADAGELANARDQAGRFGGSYLDEVRHDLGKRGSNAPGGVAATTTGRPGGDGSFVGDTRSYGVSDGAAGGGTGSADSFGAAPAAYGETYTSLGRPSWLQGEYVPGQWQGGDFVAPEKPTSLQTPYQAPTWQGGDFVAPAKSAALQSEYALPTQAELEASPGYLAGQTAMQRGMERSAAAKGSILSGGFVGRALPRAMGEYAGGAYNNLVGQTLGARQQQYGEYSGDVSNAFSQYQQRYGQFQDAAALGLQGRQQQQGEYNTDYSNAAGQYAQRYGQFADAEGLKLGARSTNEAAYQGDEAANSNQFKTRYGQFMDAAGMKRQAENDVWSRNMNVADIGLRSAALARP